MVIRGDGGEARADRTRRACSPGGQTNKGGEEHHGTGWYANLQQIKKDLLDIKEGLKKEEENNGGVIEGGELVEKLNKIIARVPRGPHAKQTTEGVEARLDRIEALLKTSTKSTPNLQVQNATWANVVAAGVRLGSGPPSPPPLRHTVRVQVPR